MKPTDDNDTGTLPIGFTLAEFKIEQVIGEGGFGVVYLALDTQLGRKVAIKEYMPSSLATRKDDLSVVVTSARHRETFDLGLRSFVKEAITLARFDHPALLKVFRFWEERGTAYMVMPYLEGQTLKQALRAQADAPSEAWLRTLLEPIFDGLEHLHAHHCLHRDIAPDNIQILPNGVPLLLDFGAARQVVGDATQALTVILKPGFAPIEQYSETATMRQGAWTDVYALAAVCYYAISGKAPPPSAGRVLHDEMLSAASIGGTRYSASFLYFIDSCLQVRPEQRPQSIAEARRLLDSPPPLTQTSAASPDDDDDRTIIRAPQRTITPAPSISPSLQPTTGSPATQGSAAAGAHAATAAPAAASAGRRRTVGLAVGAVLLITAALLAWQFRPAPLSTPDPAAPSAARSAPPTKPPLNGAASAPAVSPPVVTATAAPPAQAPSLADVPTAAPMPPPRPLLASPANASAALDQLIESRSPAITVEASAARSELTIGRDALQFSVKSPNAGYAYVFTTSPDARQLVLLYPNARDKNKRLAAGAELQLPATSWKAKAEGPAGARTILAVLSAQPRDLRLAGWKAGSTFDTYAFDPKAAPAPDPGVLGAPVCETTKPCDPSFGAARFDVMYAEPPPVVAAPRSTPPAKLSAAEAPRAARPVADNARECALLLQRASMGMDSPDISRKMAALNCR